MICLVDTSVWIAHFRANNHYLCELLETDEVLIHDLIIGELACGHLKERKSILPHLDALPRVKQATAAEMLYFIERQKLMGVGLGIVDLHLLACAKIAHAKLFTLDKRLHAAAQQLNIAHHFH